MGTYIRATNVFFDQLHRADVSSLGEPPTMRELDTRQFRNKGVYNKLLVTYLDASIKHIGYAGFTSNIDLEAMGLTDDIGMNFDALTSEELSAIHLLLSLMVWGSASSSLTCRTISSRWSWQRQ